MPKHLTRSIETDKFHLRSDRENVRLTKPITANLSENKRTREFYIKIIELSVKVCSHQTGRLIVTSRKGNKHIMVVYGHDSNDDLSKPLKSKSVVEHLQAIKEMHMHSNEKCTCPEIYVMDNEYSALVMDCIKKEEK